MYQSETAEFRLMPCHTILHVLSYNSAFNESERGNTEGRKKERKTSTEQKETIIEKPFHHQSSHKLQFYSSTNSIYLNMAIEIIITAKITPNQSLEC